MRFGLFVPQGWRLDLTEIDPRDHWRSIAGVARAAEAGPFESVWAFDHFHTTPEPTQEATHEAWTLMAALGAVTSRVRLGQMCTCAGYRNPAYLAKVAATVDAISGGRAEMGIGAGWYEHEWRAYGYGFPRAGQRLAMLEEGVQIMRQLWTDGVATLNGEHFQADGAICRPLPLQEGGIPLWIAGSGEKKTLRIAARYANYTNFGGTPEEFAHKSEVLRGHCEDVGTDFGAIVRSANFTAIIGETDKEVADKLAAIRSRFARYLSPGAVEGQLNTLSSGPMVGTPELVAERLAERGKLGMSYAIFYLPEIAYDKSGLDLLTKKVLPALAAS